MCSSVDPRSAKFSFSSLTPFYFKLRYLRDTLLPSPLSLSHCTWCLPRKSTADRSDLNPLFRDSVLREISFHFRCQYGTFWRSRSKPSSNLFRFSFRPPPSPLSPSNSRRLPYLCGSRRLSRALLHFVSPDHTARSFSTVSKATPDLFLRSVPLSIPPNRQRFIIPPEHPVEQE